jgi:hypothetical protein
MITSTLPRQTLALEGCQSLGINNSRNALRARLGSAAAFAKNSGK